MRLKTRKTPLLVAAFTIGICLIADWAAPYGVNQQFLDQPASSGQRVVPAPQDPLRNLAPMATLDLSSNEFTTRRGARLAEWREPRPQKAPGNSDSLVLIGFGFLLFESAILIRRGSTA